MSKSEELLKTDHLRQVSWLEGQIKRCNNSIFLNPTLAIPAFELLGSGDLITSESDIEAYVSRYLSDSGKNKLLTTLRVANTRAKNSFLTTLQVNLEPQNDLKLEKLAKESGLTKTELINRMIAGSNWIRKVEEQLEIKI